jgi:hypothetical protein
MAAAFVVSSTGATGIPLTGARITIFPGSATPAVFPARTPFWIGYGFVVEPGDTGEALGDASAGGTRFELEVDGEPVDLLTDVQLDDGRPVSKHSVANFGIGLPPGWHRFAGRWYDSGRLVLSSERSIEFVER